MVGRCPAPQGSCMRSAGRRPSTQRVSTGLAIDARIGSVCSPERADGARGHRPLVRLPRERSRHRRGRTGGGALLGSGSTRTLFLRGCFAAYMALSATRSSWTPSVPSSPEMKALHLVHSPTARFALRGCLEGRAAVLPSGQRLRHGNGPDTVVPCSRRGKASSASVPEASSLVEPGGIEPPSASLHQAVLHA